MRRGELYWAIFEPRSGSEQQGRRPAVLVSDDVFNETPRWSSLIVVPITTSRRQLERGPTSVFLPAGTAGLTQDSAALCHQITTLDRTKFEGFIGTLREPFLTQLEDGILFALSISRSRR